MLLADPPSSVGWAVSPGQVDYRTAESIMAARARAIADGQNEELVWLLEHPALYTAGTSAKEADLIAPNRLPVFRTGRGGQFTYHGPGQRIAYVMLDLKRRKPDVRAFVFELEAWLIDALAELGVSAERRAGRVGLWVARGGREEKIAAIGIRLSKWVSSHGISLNVDPDLSHYEGIVPCGISEHGVTSFSALGIKADMRDVDRVLRRHFENHFGATHNSTAPMAEEPRS